NLVDKFNRFKADRKVKREERKKERQAKKDSIKQSKINKGN
ncbi:MAG: hypothetical protein JWP44_30, partial [Mucilaginibacter sp.]|nr:hypothetical protein [Mucilaginibacter sp.]